jgi:NitT/TauT family transport system permease protein
MRLLNRRPGRVGTSILGVLPFILVVMAYLVGSDIRHQANPNDKLLPTPAAISQSIDRVATEPSRRSGELVLWSDTAASLERLLIGVGIAALIGLVFGVLTGMLPYASATLGPFISAVSMIPPLAILPILFIVFGLGDLAKIVLIAIGIAPFIMRDIALRVAEIPKEMLIKAQTLGASTWQVAARVVLPQMAPRLLDSVRLSLGPAWLFLIAGEAIAAEQGLGYRIFLLRRYLAMDVILPYVVWITLIAFLMDLLLRFGTRKLFPWYAKGAE